MKLIIYNDPNGQAWNITSHIPQDSLSLLQASLEEGALRASLTLELYNPDPDDDFLANVRKPGILVITTSSGYWLFALYYNPIKTEYDPTTRRYKLSFVSLLEALKAYLDKERWWNVLDAATLTGTLKAFLSQYLPTGYLNATTWLPSSMSPLQEDPANTSWPYFTGFIQPASWLVGKQVDYSPNGPYTIISVLGIAKSLVQDNVIFALCLAKPSPWWSTEGDYVLPVVIKASWNSDTWDWDIDSVYWYYDGSSGDGWWYPVWFGLKGHLPGQTGESALIYTTYTTSGERVVIAWAECPVKKPRVEPDPDEGFYYIYWPKLRLVLLDGDLTLLDQERIDLINLGGAVSVPETIILKGGGNANGYGVVFVGLNGLACKQGVEIGTNGQDGYFAILAQRWNNDTWIDEAPNAIEFGSWNGTQSQYEPYRLIGLEAFFNGSVNDATWELHRIYGHNLADGGNLNLRELMYLVGTYIASDNSFTAIAGHQWRLQFRDQIRPTPCFVVPYGPLYYNGSAYEGGLIFGYTLLEYGEGNVINPDVVFVDCLSGELTYGITDYTVNTNNAGYMELDIGIDTGGEERYDGSKADTDWTDEQVEQNKAGQLRTLIATRMRPIGIRYETQGDTRRVKFIILHQSFSEWEAFAISGEYDPASDTASILTMDGRDMAGELVPKIAGGKFNESDTWRSVIGHGTLFANEDDPRSSGYDHMGSYGVFDQPVGAMSIPVTQKVCENDKIYSEPGKLGYQNMMNPDYRYWWNVYNAHRGHIITPLAWWSFVQTELDYREKTNTALLSESWDRTVHGLSYVAGYLSIGGATANRICLVLVPRWPLKGDTHTISGSSYWEVDKPYSSLSDITERQFSLDLQGTYWDALILGPEGGALLTNIWWDEEGQMDRELLVSLKELLPQWFGIAYYRGDLYTDLLVWLRENVYPGARVGLRGLTLPVYAWGDMVPIGAIIPEDIMDDLEERDDPELIRYPITLFWQIIGLRWDLTRNRVLFTLKEIRGDE